MQSANAPLPVASSFVPGWDEIEIAYVNLLFLVDMFRHWQYRWVSASAERLHDARLMPWADDYDKDCDSLIAEAKVRWPGEEARYYCTLCHIAPERAAEYKWEAEEAKDLVEEQEERNVINGILEVYRKAYFADRIPSVDPILPAPRQHSASPSSTGGSSVILTPPQGSGQDGIVNAPLPFEMTTGQAQVERDMPRGIQAANNLPDVLGPVPKMPAPIIGPSIATFGAAPAQLPPPRPLDGFALPPPPAPHAGVPRVWPFGNALPQPSLDPGVQHLFGDAGLQPPAAPIGALADAPDLGRPPLQRPLGAAANPFPGVDGNPFQLALDDQLPILTLPGPLPPLDPRQAVRPLVNALPAPQVFVRPAVLAVQRLGPDPQALEVDVPVEEDEAHDNWCIVVDPSVIKAKQERRSPAEMQAAREMEQAGRQAAEDGPPAPVPPAAPHPPARSRPLPPDIGERPAKRPKRSRKLVNPAKEDRPVLTERSRAKAGPEHVDIRAIQMRGKGHTPVEASGSGWGMSTF